MGAKPQKAVKFNVNFYSFIQTMLFLPKRSYPLRKENARPVSVMDMSLEELEK